MDGLEKIVLTKHHLILKNFGFIFQIITYFKQVIITHFDEKE